MNNIIEKLQGEEKELQARIDDIKKQAEDNHQTKIWQLKKSMRPLDDAVAIVAEEKEKTQEKITTTEDRI